MPRIHMLRLYLGFKNVKVTLFLFLRGESFGLTSTRSPFLGDIEPALSCALQRQPQFSDGRCMAQDEDRH